MWPRKRRFPRRHPARAGLLAALAALLVIAAPGHARAAGSCGEHVVRAGETLATIARARLGTADYQRLFDANRERLAGPVPVPGTRLRLPCLAAGPAFTEGEPLPVRLGAAPEAAPEPPAPRLAALGAPEAPGLVPEIGFDTDPVAFVTGDDYPPFVDRDLPGDGMAPALIRAALAESGRAARILFTDWKAALTAPLAASGGPLSFPWYRPDCARVARLGEHMRWRCRSFVFSAPLYEVVVSFWMRQGDPRARATSHDALAGAVICRPRGFFSFDLAQLGLGPPRARLYRPADARSCFRALIEGRVDAVSMSVRNAARVLDAEGLAPLVAEAPQLATVQSLHVLARRGDLRAGAALAALDRGLERLRGDGRWYQIVSRYLDRRPLAGG